MAFNSACSSVLFQMYQWGWVGLESTDDSKSLSLKAFIATANEVPSAS